MRTVRLGAVFGALWLFGSCIPVETDPPVSGSKQILELTGQEIVALCDWATDYMGGQFSNPDDAELGGAVVHRCPGDIGVPDPDRGLIYVYFKHEECPTFLAGAAKSGCTLTVNDYAGWIEDIGETPCEHHYVDNGQCELQWAGVEEEP